MGRGVEKNYAQAVKHYMRAIEPGCSCGYPEYCIAMIYLAGGHGMERNFDTADEWFKKSAVKDYDRAKMWINDEQVRSFVKKFPDFV